MLAFFFTDLKLKFFTWSRNCLAVLRPLSLPRLWCDPSHLWYGEMTTSWGQSRRRLSLEIYKFQETSWPLCWQQLCPSLVRDFWAQLPALTRHTCLCQIAHPWRRVSGPAPSSYNFVTKSGNFWITQLVSRLITLLYDSLQLLYHRRGKQGCRDHF